MTEQISLALAKAMAGVTELPRRDEGQALVEYALILSIIAVGALFALGFLSGRINSILSTIGSAL